MGLRVAIADLGAERLADAAEAIAAASPAGDDAVLALETDVSRLDDLTRLEAAVRERFGGTDVLMNNAGIGPSTGVFGPADAWKKTLMTNLWGVIHGTQIFVPGMIARGRPGLVVNTGSKQGITTPPGNPAYNVSKAGVRVFTEALSHELRSAEGCAITAHLLIPGFVFTGLTKGDRREKPAAAWTPEQTVDFMLEQHRPRRLLHPLPGQRRAAQPRREAHPLVRRRHRREPPGAVALAPGLGRRLRGVHQEALTRRPSRPARRGSSAGRSAPPDRVRGRSRAS